eukprot:631604-Pyramimonas_sp.AAC.1
MLDSARAALERKGEVIATGAPEHVDVAVVQGRQAVLSEAVILYPMSEPLNQAMLIVGAQMQEMAKGAKEAALTAKLSEMAKPVEKDKEYEWLQAVDVAELD